MDSNSRPREDPLKIAQLKTMEDTTIVNGRIEPDTEAERVQGESRLEYIFPSPSQDEDQYTPTPVLQAGEPPRHSWPIRHFMDNLDLRFHWIPHLNHVSSSNMVIRTFICMYICIRTPTYVHIPWGLWSVTRVNRCPYR